MAAGERKPIWRTVAKWTAFALVLIVVARMFAGQFGQIDWSTVHLGPLCAAAGACLVAMHALNTRALHRALSAMAKGPSPMSVFAVMGVSRMGKYVPGKMMTLAGTIYLFHRHNVGPAVTGAAVLSNSVISVIVGLVVSAPLMLWPPVARHISEVANIPLTVYNALAWPVAVATVLAGIAALHPKVLRWGCNLALRWLKRPPLALFPGFRGTSTCRLSPTWRRRRPMAEMMPAVIVFSRPAGDPMANIRSPGATA